MGEQADYIIDRLFDPDDYNDEEPTVACKYCGRAGFSWDEDDDGRYRLTTPTGKPHFCKAYMKPIQP